MKERKTLILSGPKIKRLVGIKEAIEAVEKAFRYLGYGKAQMPPKLYIHLDQFKGDLRAMPAYIEGFKYCVIKWVNVHPGNKKIGLPTVMAVIILSDPKNGFPLCIMDATYATALRTAAAGGIAARYLARKDSHTIALIGSGVQARVQLLALHELFDIDEIKVWDIRSLSAKVFIREMKKMMPSIKMGISGTIKDCVKWCDIIVTTTPSRKPLVKMAWLAKGTHINAIGADSQGKQELDPEILKHAKVVVDSWEQASHSGEINVSVKRGLLSKNDVYANIGEIAARKKKGRTRKDEITVFDSTGLAIQDVAIANIIYKAALKRRIGTWVRII